MVRETATVWQATWTCSASKLRVLKLEPARILLLRDDSAFCVSLFQEAHNRISSHIPLIIQYFILKMFADQLQKGMLQLLQEKDSCSWLLKERNDTSEKRKFLKERLSRLAQARRRLAKFPG